MTSYADRAARQTHLFRATAVALDPRRYGAHYLARAPGALAEHGSDPATRHFIGSGLIMQGGSPVAPHLDGGGMSGGDLVAPVLSGGGLSAGDVVAPHLTGGGLSAGDLAAPHLLGGHLVAPTLMGGGRVRPEVGEMRNVTRQAHTLARLKKLSLGARPEL